MRIRTFSRRGTRAVITVCLVTLVYLSGARAQLPAPKWPVQPKMVDLVRSDFEQGGILKELTGRAAFEKLASIVAVPFKETPIDFKQLTSLEGRSVPIGLVYLPGGSDRLGLPPGPYSVQLSRSGNNWAATFVDANGKEQSRRAARVEQLPNASGPPTAYVDHSVCYQFDHTIVCI